MSDLLEEIGLNDCIYDKCSFDGRLEYGLHGELIFKEALKRQIIPNKGIIELPEVKDKEGVIINATNGDVAFVEPFFSTIEFVDVKCTNYVSKSSLKRFRSDGWFMFNAFIYSDNMFYFMIRNNQAFKDHIKNFPCPTRDGYLVNFWQIPSDTERRGLELYVNMDPKGYKNLIMDIKVALEKKGLDHNVIKKD